jgi:hypothetical protein
VSASVKGRKWRAVVVGDVFVVVGAGRGGGSLKLTRWKKRLLLLTEMGMATGLERQRGRRKGSRGGRWSLFWAYSSETEQERWGRKGVEIGRVGAGSVGYMETENKAAADAVAVEVERKRSQAIGGD